MMDMIKVFITLLLCSVAFGLRAQQVDTITIHSNVMDNDVKNIIILPADYKNNPKVYPVLYLLHGYNNDYRSWLRIKPELPEFASQYGMIIVCPDGKSSWYWDSPIKPKQKYETYVVNELIKYVDEHYKTIEDKNGRAITGFSMGGHGGMWLAIRHQDLFGACGATSGGVDICPFPDNWEIKNALGAYQENVSCWDEHTVMNLLPLIRPELAIIFDCGTADFFYEVNEKLHREMLYRNIQHDYTSRPGGHEDAYWNNSIEYHLLLCCIPKFSLRFRKD